VSGERKHTYADIILRWRDSEAAGFDATLAFDHPSDASDYQEFVGSPVVFDTGVLEALVAEDEQYAVALTKMMFTDPAMASFIDRALETSNEMPVHLRLLIDPDAPAKYQAIRWETLRDTNLERRLTTQQQVRFSRYMTGYDWRRVHPLARAGKLKALVAVANPSNLEDARALGAAPLAAIKVDDEIARARQALEPMLTVETLPDDTGRRATLDQIIARLTDADVLYLACHGEIWPDDSVLYLENDRGEVDVVAGKSLADRISDLAAPPTIAVLVSCQSAGPGDDYLPSERGALTPTGPRLARAGVAVVVAMQGNVTMRTARIFLPRFFKELEKDGLADRAMAAARSEITGYPDWWMPVLFSRLRRGRAWYEPRFGAATTAILRDLHTRIAEQRVLPIIGSGLAGTGVLLTREELALDWVRRRQIPIVESSRHDLAKVAQYMSVDSGPDFPSIALSRYLRGYLRKNHESAVAGIDWENDALPNLISTVGQHSRAHQGPDDPMAILASLRLPIYVTTSWTDLLEDALIEAGRPPQVGSFDWQSSIPKFVNVDEEPSPERPLVYHLFGSLSKPKSVVLTEDDYFAWLRAWTKQVDNNPAIPDCVKSALTENSLIFVGYGLDDWEFRVLFQSIKAFEANRSMRGRQHIGVQLRPESVNVDQDSALDYLERYFDEDRVDVYWGSGIDFLRDVRAAGNET
jgi:hypothetical protein